MSVTVREATADDRLDVRRVLDAAMLRVRDDLGERIDAGDVLVASEGGGVGDDGGTSDDAPILGALVLAPRERGGHVDAVAVRRARRGQGVGSALVRAATERHAPLTAEFDPSVRPFYESLGFEISRVEGDDDRLRGCYDATED
ncbi:GNAT family N-acetyltransferase [Halorussus salinisoli]|uniref:GNAT family N-acetyltransferase n=1 Tax=Halorussus salinisoli TaxID=2558242 RepID=UPI0010C17493|nr:GNAT family N-acetyltransferase [Halorussus salinisoli]